MLGIEQHNPELLHGSSPELRQQECRGLAGRDDLHAIVSRSNQRATAELDRGNDLGGFRRAKAPHLLQLVARQSCEPIQAAGRLEHGVGDGQRAHRAHAGANDDREQLVVAEPRGAEAGQLLSRPIGRNQSSHILYQMRFAMLALVAAGAVSAGCANPPDKEMQQAQGAIDAARASGAEQYASDDYRAAVTALKQSQDAVDQRDYRLALDRALDSRDRAQGAARTAADQKAVVRSDAEQMLRDVETAIAQARERFKAAENARASASTLADARQAIDAAEKALQEARAALGRLEYLEARKATADVADRLQAAMQRFSTGDAGRTTRRRR